MTKKEKLKNKIDRLFKSYLKRNLDLNCSLEELKFNTLVHSILYENNINSFKDILSFNTDQIFEMLKKLSLINNFYYSCRTFIKNNNESVLKVNNENNECLPLIEKLRQVDEYKLDSNIAFEQIGNVRLQNALKKANIITYKDLSEFGDYSKIESIGKKCINDLEIHLKTFINNENITLQDYKQVNSNPIEEELKKEINKFSINLYNSMLNKTSIFDDSKYQVIQNLVVGNILDEMSNYLNKKDFKLIKLRYADLKTIKDISEIYNCSKQNISYKLIKLSNRVYIKYIRSFDTNEYLLRLLKCLNYLKNDILFGYISFTLNHESLDTDIIKKILERLNFDSSIFIIENKREIKEVEVVDDMTIEDTIIYKSIKNIIDTKINYVTLLSLYNFLQGNVKDNSKLNAINGFGMYKNIDKNKLLESLIRLYNMKKINVKVTKHGRLYCVIK